MFLGLSDPDPLVTSTLRIRILPFSHRSVGRAEKIRKNYIKKFICTLKVIDDFCTDPHPDPYQNVTDPEHCYKLIPFFLEEGATVCYQYSVNKILTFSCDFSCFQGLPRVQLPSTGLQSKTQSFVLTWGHFVSTFSCREIILLRHSPIV
jgi:hypothetical protein